MSVPASPTIASIVTEALKRAGRTTPSATQISDATEHQFREVKADISLKAALCLELQTQTLGMVYKSLSQVTWPTDAEAIRAISLVEYPDEGYYRDAAVAVTGNFVTVDPLFDANEDDLLGHMIYFPTGGAVAWGQIYTYNNATKVVEVGNWVGTPPLAGREYFIETGRRKIWDRDKPVWYTTESVPFSTGTPQYAVLTGRSIDLYPVSNKRTVLIWDYWYQLDQLDDTSEVLLRHIRTYRSLWVQGIATKCMQRYDEDRYMTEMGVYQDMLAAYAGLASTVGQTIFRDV